MECRAFIQFDSFHRSKMINFFQNHWCLILPADLCQPIRGRIQSKSMNRPFPTQVQCRNGARPLFLPNCSRYSAFDERQSRDEVGDRLASSTTPIDSLLPVRHRPGEAGYFFLLTIPNTQRMPVISVTNRQFNLSLYANQFFLTCGSGKAELLSVHPELR